MHSLTRWSVMARHARKSICIRNLCGGKVWGMDSYKGLALIFLPRVRLFSPLSIPNVSNSISSDDDVSVHPPTENSLALRERVRVRACKTRVLQMPSPPAPLPQGEGGERLHDDQLFIVISSILLTAHLEPLQSCTTVKILSIFELCFI
jgi:hypothetical protein